MRQVAEAVPEGGFAVYSGSVAPGLPDDFVASIKTVLDRTRTRLVVDVAGVALDHLLEHPAGLYALRIDQNDQLPVELMSFSVASDARRTAVD